MSAAAVAVISAVSELAPAINVEASGPTVVVGRRHLNEIHADEVEAREPADDALDLARRPPTSLRCSGCAALRVCARRRGPENSLLPGAMPGSTTSMSKLRYTGVSPTRARMRRTISATPRSSMSSVVMSSNPTCRSCSRSSGPCSPRQWAEYWMRGRRARTVNLQRMPACTLDASARRPSSRATLKNVPCVMRDCAVSVPG
jgi:hypothetical protein